MTDLDKALADITAIRSQMARGAEFRGYGPATVAAMGVLAILAAGIQALWLPNPATDVFNYLALWWATAAISVLLIGIEMVARTRRIHSGLADEMIHAASEQFVPAGVAGVLLTFVLYRFAPQSLWMLPRHLRLLPIPAAPHVRGRGVVPRHGPRESRIRERGARIFALCDGRAVWGRANLHRSGSLLQYRRVGCRRLNRGARRPGVSPMTGSTASSTRRRA
jgi:hypothetical protein